MLIALVATVLAVALPSLIYRYIKLQQKLTPEEQTVLGFNYTPLQFAPKVWQNATYNMPLSPEALTGNAATLPSPQNSPSQTTKPPIPTQILPKLTFILQNSGRNMAILDGSVANAGISVNGWKVIKIETDRVLVQARGKSRWITME